MDRQVLSLLKGFLEVEFDWTNNDYSNIVIVFHFLCSLHVLCRQVH